MDQITSKFIEFGLDDSHSGSDNDTRARLNKLHDHYEKNVFKFETPCLDLPKGSEEPDEHLIPDLESLQALQTADTEMGKDLDDIFKIMNTQAREDLGGQNVVIEHRWNSKTHKFDRWSPINK